MDPYLQQLIAMRTVSDDRETNNTAVEFLEDFFKKHGMHIVSFEFEGRKAFIATTQEGNKTPKLMLGAHVDVVPGPDELFTLRLEDGKYYGRGVYDMKFSIACYMHVVELLKDELGSYDFGIMVTSDEEIGGLGVEKLVEAGYIPEICILPDGGQDWNIEKLAKGIMSCRVEVTGKASHGSRPWEGDSATFKLIDILSEIKELFAGQGPLTDTLNIGMLEGGSVVNQLPAFASASLDIRYIKPESKDKHTSEITTIAEKHGGVFTLVASSPPIVIDMEHPVVKAFQESIKKVTGVQSEGTVSFGASDARYLAPSGTHCLLTHPAGGGQHADGEWIDQAGYDQFTDVLIDYIRTIAK